VNGSNHIRPNAGGQYPEPTPKRRRAKSNKRVPWGDVMARLGGAIPINKAVLVHGRDLVVKKCVICGKRHCHGWAYEQVGDKPSHRLSHCYPEWRQGYFLVMEPGAGHETVALGSRGCRVLEMSQILHPYVAEAA
jgi:hypothetical protein